jgi:hypothetical protein
MFRNLLAKIKGPQKTFCEPPADERFLLHWGSETRRHLATLLNSETTPTKYYCKAESFVKVRINLQRNSLFTKVNYVEQTY